MFERVRWSPDIEGGWPGTGNNDADPLFVDPDNGDFRLQPDSPSIDAGDNAVVSQGVLRDLNGTPRFVPVRGIAVRPWRWGRTSFKARVAIWAPY